MLLILLNEPRTVLMYLVREGTLNHIYIGQERVVSRGTCAGSRNFCSQVLGLSWTLGFSDCQGLFLHLLVTAPGFSFLGSLLSPCALGGAVSTLENGMTAQASILAWRIPRTEDSVHRFTKSWTQLKQLSTHVSTAGSRGGHAAQAWLTHCLALVTGRVQSHDLSWSNQSLPWDLCWLNWGRDLSCYNSGYEGRIKS